MKTKAQVLKDNPNYSKLINAVISRIGIDSVEDVINHGIDGGFSGFIYYTETHKFAMSYQKLIVQLLEEQADQLGEQVPEMVANFGVFHNSKMDAEDRKDLYRYLSGGRPQQCAITNVMAWFAAEEVCRMFDN